MRKTLAMLLVLSAACGKGPPPGPETPRCDGVRAGKAFLTYNMANASGMVPLATPRRPVAIDGLATTAFDVACLQEVWGAGHAEAIKAGLGLDDLQSFYSDTAGLRENGKDVCNDTQLSGIADCAAKECSGVPADEEASICVREKCSGWLLGVHRSPGGPECFNCLVASAGKSIAETKATCTGVGSSRIQGGASSAMLVAKNGRLYDKEPMLLESSGSNRTALFATVRMPDRLGAEHEIEVACTHIAASAPVPPTHSGYATWEDEKRAQIAAIAAKLEQRARRKDGTMVPMVFMGDMNAGPDSSPDVWQAMTAAGFECPTADRFSGGGCSSCDDNSFHDGGSGGSMIDHVCVRNPDLGHELTSVCTDRVLDKKVVVKGYDGVTEIETHPSDHYGKRALFDLGRPGSPF